MRPTAIFTCLTLFCGTVTAQVTSKTPQNRQFFVEPRERILPLIAYQPDSPIVFERVRYLHDVKGGGVDEYSLRNRAHKPIVSMVIVTLYLKGGESLIEYKARNQNEWIMPGNTWPQEGATSRIVPLKDEIQKEYEKDPEMKALMILLVVSVEFSDGSKYDDKKVYEALISLRDRVEITMR